MQWHEPSALLDGVRFESVPADRTDAVIVTEWTGLDEGVTMRRENVPRPGAHGAFAQSGHLDARVLGMSGHVIAPTPEKLLHKVRQVRALLADGGFSQLAIAGERNVTLEVGRAGQPAVKVRGNDPCVADFQLQLWAPDPRMYGDVHDFPGGAPAVNWGTFPARPSLVVSGAAASGYTVTGPGGRRVVVTKGLAAGAPHTIDFARGGLWIGGIRQMRAISVYEPWEIPAGLPGVAATVNNGASLIQRVTDTFV